MIFFILCTLAFQFYIGLFVDELNEMRCTIEQLNVLDPVKILKDNPTFCPDVEPSSADLQCCIKSEGELLLTSAEIPAGCNRAESEEDNNVDFDDATFLTSFISSVDTCE